MSDESSKKVGIIIAIAIVIFGGIFIGSLNSITSATKNPTPEPVKNVKTESVVETKTIKKTEYVAYGTTKVYDNTIAKGNTVIRTPGVSGVIERTYEVKYEDGKEVSRKLKKEAMTKAPTNEVIAIGTRVAVYWMCYDTTSYDKNPYNDNYCVSTDGRGWYVSDSQARALDPTYRPGQSGHPYYNSF